MKLQFDGTLWYCRGPAPWYFVTVPPRQGDEIEAISTFVTYGWGMIPATVRIGNTEWKTALWPKDGGYIVPVKARVRTAETLEEGDRVTVFLEVHG